MSRVTLLYFASLRDATGCASEAVEVDSPLLSSVYECQRSRYGFAMPMERLRVAINGAFVDWTAIAADGDEIAFIPPVSGG